MYPKNSAKHNNNNNNNNSNNNNNVNPNNNNTGTNNNNANMMNSNNNTAYQPDYGYPMHPNNMNNNNNNNYDAAMQYYQQYYYYQQCCLAQQQYNNNNNGMGMDSMNSSGGMPPPSFPNNNNNNQNQNNRKPMNNNNNNVNNFHQHHHHYNNNNNNNKNKNAKNVYPPTSERDVSVGSTKTDDLHHTPVKNKLTNTPPRNNSNNNDTSVKESETAGEVTTDHNEIINNNNEVEVRLSHSPSPSSLHTPISDRRSATPNPENENSKSPHHPNNNEAENNDNNNNNNEATPPAAAPGSLTPSSSLGTIGTNNNSSSTGKNFLRTSPLLGSRPFNPVQNFVYNTFLSNNTILQPHISPAATAKSEEGEERETAAEEEEEGKKNATQTSENNTNNNNSNSSRPPLPKVEKAPPVDNNNNNNFSKRSVAPGAKKSAGPSHHHHHIHIHSNTSNGNINSTTSRMSSVGFPSTPASPVVNTNNNNNSNNNNNNNTSPNFANMPSITIGASSHTTPTTSPSSVNRNNNNNNNNNNNKRYGPPMPPQSFPMMDNNNNNNNRYSPTFPPMMPPPHFPMDGPPHHNHSHHHNMNHMNPHHNHPNNNNNNNAFCPPPPPPMMIHRQNILYQFYSGQDYVVENRECDVCFNHSTFGNYASLVEAFSPEVPVAEELEIPTNDVTFADVNLADLMTKDEAAKCAASDRPTEEADPPYPHYENFEGPYFSEAVLSLTSVWSSFDFPYGCSVLLSPPAYLSLMKSPEERVVYTPVLSGFRIRFLPHSAAFDYLTKERQRQEGEEGGRLPPGLVCWSASERPDNRNGVSEQIEELVEKNNLYKVLQTATTADVDHQSWIAILWCPDFVNGHTAKHSCGSFLSFYLLRPPHHLFIPFANKSNGAAMNSSWLSSVFRTDKDAVAFDIYSLRRSYHLARVIPNNTNTNNNNAAALQRYVRLPVIGLIPNRCRNDVWMLPIGIDHQNSNNPNNNNNSNEPAVQWAYKAPLFLIASALQLMSWNAFECHLQIDSLQNKTIANENNENDKNEEEEEKKEDDTTTNNNNSPNPNTNTNTNTSYFEKGVSLLCEGAKKYRQLREQLKIEDEGSVNKKVVVGGTSLWHACHHNNNNNSETTPNNNNNHLSCIVGLLDFYQWSQYDTALLDLAKECCV